MQNQAESISSPIPFTSPSQQRSFRHLLHCQPRKVFPCRYRHTRDTRRDMKRHSFILVFFYCVLIPLPTTQSGERDWPQWRGPKRDGHSPAKNLMKSWPEGGPQVRWSFTEAGIGYSTVAAADERLYTLGAIEDRCFAICVSLKDGSLIWKTDFLSSRYRRRLQYWLGSRTSQYAHHRW